MEIRYYFKCLCIYKYGNFIDAEYLKTAVWIILAEVYALDVVNDPLSMAAVRL